jgi:type II secretory pathway pseudopilin PulG
MMMVFVIVGALAVFGFPKMLSTTAKGEVRGARTKVVALFNRARAHAIERNRHVTMRITSTLVVVTESVPGGGVDTLHIEDFAPAGVGLTTNAATIQVDPRGVATSLGGTTATIAMSKGSYADSVLISGFGRVLNQ